jgi:predicted ATP-dependent protease
MTEQGEIHTVVLEQKSRGAHSDADAKFACERQAFWAMHSQLLSMYEGKYVAVLNGQVVDSDVDERTLVQRVSQKFGY